MISNDRFFPSQLIFFRHLIIIIIEIQLKNILPFQVMDSENLLYIVSEYAPNGEIFG